MKHSRVQVTGYSRETMLRMAADVTAAIKARIGSGRDVHDQAAPALKTSYARFKVRRGARPIRDLRLTGRTLSALHAISAGVNQVTIGFSDPEAEKRVRLNQTRSQQVGMSPADKRVAVASLMQGASPVRIVSGG